jgi:hypothetical protein
MIDWRIGALQLCMCPMTFDNLSPETHSPVYVAIRSITRSDLDVRTWRPQEDSSDRRRQSEIGALCLR